MATHKEPTIQGCSLRPLTGEQEDSDTRPNATHLSGMSPRRVLIVYLWRVEMT